MTLVIAGDRQQADSREGSLPSRRRIDISGLACTSSTEREWLARSHDLPALIYPESEDSGEVLIDEEAVSLIDRRILITQASR